MKACYGKIGNINPSKKTTTKLGIMDYVFCFKNEDLNNASLEYFFDQIQYI